MVIYKCDRCGKKLSRYEASKAAIKANRTHGRVLQGVWYLIAEDYEFCSKCKKELSALYDDWENQFTEWMMEKPKEDE